MSDQMNTMDLLDAHDIRYLSPAEEGRFGLPIGNGDLTAMVWTPPGRLRLAVNKSNAFDDALELPVPDWNWSPRAEDKMTALVSCATLSISNHLPVYETTYLDDFEARLGLGRGVVSVDARSPFCSGGARAFVTREPDVVVVDLDEITAEPVEREITLARWGSRRFYHWYAQISRDTSVGLSGTSAGCDSEHVWIEQKLRRISFAVVGRFAGAAVRMERPNSHTARIITEQVRQLQGQLFLAVVTSEEHEDPLAEAKRRVDQAASVGLDALVEETTKRWADFWSRSFVRLPDAYLENLYYFSLYQLGACATGAHPPRHHGGTWLSNHDAGQWGAHYHWCQQMVTWPVHVAGHPELALNYYQWRYKGLEYARETARKVHGIGGAFYTDIADRDGRQGTNGETDTHLDYNLTPGSQIAMDFWRHYQYTGDREFLRQRAYPVMKAAAQFYLEYIQKNESGTYHVPASIGLEGHLRVQDCVADVTIIRSSFAACIEAATLMGEDTDLQNRWQDVLENLADYALVEEDDQAVIASGIALEDEVGISPEVGRPYHKGEALFYNASWLSMTPAYPSGVVGLGQAGTELFGAARNGVRMAGAKADGGWMPTAIPAARLGMADLALEWLGWYVKHCQRLPQGFLQEGLGTEGATDIWAVVTPKVVDNGQLTDERIELLSRRFDRPAVHCNCNVMTMIHEMLLHSHDGTIRVFPATPEAWGNAAFRLHTVGGFVVTSVSNHRGRAKYVLVESTRGGVCRVANPWGVHVAVQEVDSEEPPVISGDDVIEFVTELTVTYLVRPAGQAGRPVPPSTWELPAPGPREAYDRFLGIPRYF